MSDNDIPPTDQPVEDRPPDAPLEMPIPRLPRPPFWMVAILLVVVTVSWSGGTQQATATRLFTDF